MWEVGEGREREEGREEGREGGKVCRHSMGLLTSSSAVPTVSLSSQSSWPLFSSHFGGDDLSLC